MTSHEARISVSSHRRALLQGCDAISWFAWYMLISLGRDQPIRNLRSRHLPGREFPHSYHSSGALEPRRDFRRKLWIQFWRFAAESATAADIPPPLRLFSQIISTFRVLGQFQSGAPKWYVVCLHEKRSSLQWSNTASEGLTTKTRDIYS